MNMKRRTRHAIGIVGIVAASIMGGMAIVAVVSGARDGAAASAVAVAQPALTVAVTRLQSALLPVRIQANGNVMPWQEASIGTEADGLRLSAVKVNVGDRVRRGEVLATFASDTIAATLAQSRAATAEAQAALAEAQANAQRARALQSSGALSAQQIHQYLIAQQTAQARLQAGRALEKVQHLRLAQAQVLAPDDGIISARTATLGAVLPAGQELFRLIRQGRLEWRAEVAAADLARFTPGQVARVIAADGTTLEGRVRRVAPMVDTQTRNGVVYVDLPEDSAVRAGMFARGEFEIATEPMMTLPQSAVLLRDGFSYVMQVGPQSRVVQLKVAVGRRIADRIEITGGIDLTAQVVLAGAGFLTDGDLVRVVSNPVSFTEKTLGSAQ